MEHAAKETTQQAEAAVIGACIADPNAIVFVAGEVKPDDFTVPVYNWVARAIWSCFETRTPPTMAAVIETLQTQGRWSNVTTKTAVSMADIDGVLQSVTDSDVQYAVHNARLVRDAAFRRRGHASIIKAAEYFKDRNLTPNDVQIKVLTAVGHVFDGRASRDAGISSIGEEERGRLGSMTDGDLPGVSCGIGWLDGLTGGFLPAETWVIAAPYKMRKTTVALNMVLSAARAGAPVSVFTVGDSSRDSTYRKLLSMVMNQLMIGDPQASERQPVSSKTLQYRLRDAYYNTLKDRASAILEAYPVRLYDGRDLVGSLNETARILRRDAAMYGTRVFVYDYAQAANYGTNDYERTTYFAGWTQQIVGELGVTGIAVSQLNEATVNAGSSDSYSPGAKGGGALPAMANVFLVTRYEEPTLTVELKLARDTRMGDKVTHTVCPPSGLILDAGKRPGGVK